MSVKTYLYFVSAVLVVWSLDSVNINLIFKKNKVLQARIFYFILAMSLIYLFTNFIFDFFTSSSYWGG